MKCPYCNSEKVENGKCVKCMALVKTEETKVEKPTIKEKEKK